VLNFKLVLKLKNIFNFYFKVKRSPWSINMVYN